MSSRIDDVAFDERSRNPREIGTLWERFNAGLIEGPEVRSPYQQALIGQWKRSAALGVDRSMRHSRLLAAVEFERRQRAGDLLLKMAKPVIKDVGHFLGDIPGLIILTEDTGCILHISGDERVCEEAARPGIVEGSMWDEASAGTNGMGTALALRRPVHIHAAEHYCEGWRGWTCAAAPIFDSDAETILGIVDFTTVERDMRDQALALSASVANSIHARLALHRQLDLSRVIMAYSDIVRRYPHDDVLALDHHGRVITHSNSERCRRVAAHWNDDVSESVAVRQSTEVSSPDGGARIGTIVILATEAAPRARPITTASAFRDRSGATLESVRSFGSFLTRDAAMGRVLDELDRIAPTSVSVLILGETGTGKELLARHLHHCSPRCNEPYLAVNCGAVNAELMESTFFGYGRGAFTGADARGRAGCFEAAGAGTLFLDEVGELPLSMQAALLRVLEDGSYQRVGTCHTRQARCRIVAATHRDLERLVAEGGFRQDLYYRLKIAQKRITPLRERRCDIGLLIDRFAEQLQQKHEIDSLSLTAEARRALEQHDWPGNARELRNVIEAALLSSAGQIDLDSLPSELWPRPEVTSAPIAPLATLIEIAPVAERSEASPLPSIQAPSDERERIIQLLRKYRRVGRAAKALGIARSTLYRKFTEFGIDQASIVSSDD